MRRSRSARESRPDLHSRGNSRPRWGTASPRAQDLQFRAVTPDVETDILSPVTDRRQGIECEADVVAVEERAVVDELPLVPRCEFEVEESSSGPFGIEVTRAADSPRSMSLCRNGLTGHDHVVGAARGQAFCEYERARPQGHSSGSANFEAYSSGERS